MNPAPAMAFDNSYVRELQGCYVAGRPAPCRAVRLLHFNRELADELGLDVAHWTDELHAEVWAGQSLPGGAQPIAQAYAGHQFGGFSAQLGDGRALLLGEVIDRRGQRRDIALKGSGRTAFSRGGDGKAAVGPMLRELLMGEALHALGIPTTRALAVVATGEPVLRERVLPGAVVARVAASHLRVGTFEYFAARGQWDLLRKVADYAIARHDPQLMQGDDRHLAFLEAVGRRQAILVAQWMGVGFIHGVMNTDNMSISGETIDYGPCAFMEAHDPLTVFSSIDHHGRYAFGRQGAIAQWNLARLAEALLPLIDEDSDRAIEKARGVVSAFGQWHLQAWLRVHRAKLGLPGPGDGEGCAGRSGVPGHSRASHSPVLPAADEAGDEALARDWLSLMQAAHADHTLSWRALTEAAVMEAQAQEWAVANGDPTTVAASLQDPARIPAPLEALFPESDNLRTKLAAWLTRWQQRRSSVEQGLSLAAMRASNPVVIPRNHRVEEALSAASEGQDLEPCRQLLAAITRPFDEALHGTRYAEPAPADFARQYRTFCGT